MKKATVGLFLDKRATKDETGIIKWLVTSERKQRLFTTGKKVTPDEWDFLQKYKSGLKGHVKDEDRRKLWNEVYGQYTGSNGKKKDGYLLQAQNVVNALGDNFEFDVFIDALNNYGKLKEPDADKTNVIEALNKKAEFMRVNGRIGNGLNFELAAKSLLRFVSSFNNDERKEFLHIPLPRRIKANEPRPTPTLQFKHLTPDFLHTYEQWMLLHGKYSQSPFKAPAGASLTTVGIYLRHLRVVVNEAIDNAVILKSEYPFGSSKYVIPAGENIKKALTKMELEKIKAYKPLPGTMEQRSHDIWLFSYYCNGMNITDICNLTWGKVKDNKIIFVRQKTARSNKQKLTYITAFLNSQTIQIIERWGTSDRKETNYVFPILQADMTPERKKDVVKQLTKVTNKWMNRIAKSLGIESDVNTYAARHTFATTLLKSKAPLSFISKQLGHTNLKTTESYLGSFDDEEAKSFLNAL